MPPLSRRRLLAAPALAALAGPLAPGRGDAAPAQKKRKPVAPSDPNTVPIVDTHQHLWDLAKFRLPWLSGAPHLNRSFLMSDYLEATTGLNVVKTVYMEVDVTPEQHVAEAEYVLDLCRRDDNPMVGAVIGGRPASPGFADYVKRFKDAKEIKGVRQVLHGDTPKGYCLAPEFAQGVRLLGEHGKSFDLCMRSGELDDAVKLVDSCPGTRFILDHCGNMSVQDPDRSAWARGIDALAQRKNVVCKVSGIVVTAKPGEWKAADLQPVIGRVLEAFGPDRVMFGGDWPVCTKTASFRQWTEALQSLVRDRKVEERKKLFHDNAVRFYGLT